MNLDITELLEVITAKRREALSGTTDEKQVARAWYDYDRALIDRWYNHLQACRLKEVEPGEQPAEILESSGRYSQYQDDWQTECERKFALLTGDAPAWTHDPDHLYSVGYGDGYEVWIVDSGVTLIERSGDAAMRVQSEYDPPASLDHVIRPDDVCAGTWAAQMRMGNRVKRSTNYADIKISRAYNPTPPIRWWSWCWLMLSSLGAEMGDDLPDTDIKVGIVPGKRLDIQVGPGRVRIERATTTLSVDDPEGWRHTAVETLRNDFVPRGHGEELLSLTALFNELTSLAGYTEVSEIWDLNDPESAAEYKERMAQRQKVVPK